MRESNQDRVYTTRLGGCEVVVVADGLGGLPRGEEAAEFAASQALLRLRRKLPSMLRLGPAAVRTLLVATIWSVAVAMARDAARRGLHPDADGFRSTLVVLVALPDAYAVAWVGDGGVVVVRVSGEVVQLVVPHKSMTSPDILDASLGPEIEGRPGWAIAPRLPGDLVLAATDGIADALTPDLIADAQQALERAGRHARRAARAVVEDIAATGEITDNLSLALITTSTSPCADELPATEVAS